MTEVTEAARKYLGNRIAFLMEVLAFACTLLFAVFAVKEIMEYLRHPYLRWAVEGLIGLLFIGSYLLPDKPATSEPILPATQGMSFTNLSATRKSRWPMYFGLFLWSMLVVDLFLVIGNYLPTIQTRPVEIFQGAAKSINGNASFRKDLALDGVSQCNSNTNIADTMFVSLLTQNYRVESNATFSFDVARKSPALEVIIENIEIVVESVRPIPQGLDVAFEARSSMQTLIVAIEIGDCSGGGEKRFGATWLLDDADGVEVRQWGNQGRVQLNDEFQKRITVLPFTKHPGIYRLRAELKYHDDMNSSKTFTLMSRPINILFAPATADTSKPMKSRQNDDPAPPL